jgi:hypothetical protein
MPSKTLSSIVLVLILLVLLLAASGCGGGKTAAPEGWSHGTLATVAPGHYEDGDQKVEFKGKWWPDHQFPQSSGQSITYSDKPGDTFRFAFHGSAIIYVFTKALNRGIAEVRIDGGPPVRVNEYSLATQWQSKQRFGGLNSGDHTLEVRVSGEKDPASGGLFVDLDAFDVEP